MKHFYLLLCLVLFSVTVRAEIFQVEDIRIDGLQRVSSGTVFASMPLSVGDLIDGDTVRRTTRALFRTGYFDDIQISRDAGVLIIAVKERPAIAELTIEGNTAIPTEDLLKSLRDNGLAEGQIFRQSILEGMSRELERQYVGQGRYGAEISTDVKELPRNRVLVNINVNEGDVAAISHINIVGNQDFDDDDLTSEFELKTTGLLSFFTNDDKYSREKLSGDLERLESWYLNRGYLNFSVDSTQVAISPDRESVFVTINVTEGSIYTVSDIELAGDPVISESEVRSLVVQKEGETFSQVLMTRSSELIAQRLGNDGYTFAEIKGVPEVNEEDKTTKLTFFIDPGNRAYVRRIEFRGNTKTMDQVLRREMRQMEGASASTAKIEYSKTRLERTGFFKEVELETRPVPGVEDQIDVFYTVEEQPSGSVGASFGFAQTYGVVLGANISESNFLGTGNRVSLGLNQSGFQTNLSLNYTNPYFTKDGVSAGFGVFARKQDYDEANVSNYTTESFGASTTFGYPVSETEYIGYGLGFENLTIDTGTFRTTLIDKFLDENGSDFNILTANLSWSQSTLNKGRLATRGSSQRFAVEATIPVGDLHYYKLSYDAQHFQPLTKSLTMRFHTKLGYGDSYGSTSRLPFFKNFYSGGFGSVRGFKKNTLGPRDIPLDPLFADDSEPFGGNVVIEGTAEMMFPLPFIKDQRSIQAVVFMDAGNVFDTDCGNVDEDFCLEPDLSDLRYSFGIGGTWISSFGPITISLAKPVNAGDEDEEEIFQFSMGQTF
jgi:outer membrane protein insertion porin family